MRIDLAAGDADSPQPYSDDAGQGEQDTDKFYAVWVSASLSHLLSAEKAVECIVFCFAMITGTDT